MSTVRDALIIAAVGIASGGAGWWARGTVDEWKMRRVLTRVHATLHERGGRPPG